MTKISSYYELSPLTYCFAAISLITFFYSDDQIKEFISDGFNQVSGLLTGVIEFVH